MNLVGHRDRAFETALEVLVLVGDREVLLHRAEVILVLCQRRAFLGIAQGDEALERSLGPVESVGVDLVGADRDLDRRILQIHPRHLAFEIVVVQEALRAQRKEPLEARVGCAFGSLFEQARGRHQPFAIGLRIRHRDEAVAAPLDHRIGTGKSLALIGIGCQIGVEFLSGQVGGIEAGSFGHGLRTPEGPQFGDLVPRTEIAIEHRQQQVAIGPAAARDRLAQLGQLHAALAQVDLVHVTAGFDQQVYHLALFLGKEAGVGGHFDGRQLGVLRAQIVIVRGCIGGCRGRADTGFTGGRGAADAGGAGKQQGQDGAAHGKSSKDCHRHNGNTPCCADVSGARARLTAPRAYPTLAAIEETAWPIPR